MEIEERVLATPKERLFGNLNILKKEIEELNSRVKYLESIIEACISWEPIITDDDTQ